MAEGETISVREFNRLQAESIHRKGVIKDLRAKLETVTAQVAEKDTAYKALEATVAQITTERDGLQAKLTAAPSELQAELDKLRGEITLRDHRSKFESLAKDHIRPEAIEAAWKLADWKAEGDVDEAKMSEAIVSLVGSSPFLKPAPDGAAVSASGTQSTVRQQRPSGPGLTRGGVSAGGETDPQAALAKKYPNPGRLA